jgi:hypothetical protein
MFLELYHLALAQSLFLKLVDRLIHVIHLFFLVVNDLLQLIVASLQLCNLLL